MDLPENVNMLWDPFINHDWVETCKIKNKTQVSFITMWKTNTQKAIIWRSEKNENEYIDIVPEEKI